MKYSYEILLMYVDFKMPVTNLQSKNVQAIQVIAAYWAVSILAVFLNKTLLSGLDADLDAPLFVTWFQCAVSAVICYTMSALRKVFPRTVKFPKGSPWDLQVLPLVLPLSILFTAMISANNMCLKHVDVAFYNIGRSLTTLFSVILSFMLFGERTSLGCLACCGAIVTGFWLGVNQENEAGSLSVVGTTFGVVGSVSGSMYSIYAKRTLPYLGQKVWLLTFYNNIYSSFLFIPFLILNGELRVVANYPNLFDLGFWAIMIVGSVCGLAVGFLSALQLKMTSPLPYELSRSAKSGAQTILATYWYSESKSTLWWFSNAVVLVGTISYSRLKQMDMEITKHTASIIV